MIGRASSVRSSSQYIQASAAAQHGKAGVVAGGLREQVDDLVEATLGVSDVEELGTPKRERFRDGVAADHERVIGCALGGREVAGEQVPQPDRTPATDQCSNGWSSWRPGLSHASRCASKLGAGSAAWMHATAQVVVGLKLRVRIADGRRGRHGVGKVGEPVVEVVAAGELVVDDVGDAEKRERVIEAAGHGETARSRAARLRSRSSL